MRNYALDFETYYDAECSVKTLGIHHYCRHPKFDAYMISIVGDDGLEYCGRPEAFDWSKISGADTRWLHHNASFDAHILHWLRETKKIPEWATPSEWRCTADMAAYFGFPRNLAGAMKTIFNISPDKTVRDKMKGRDYDQLSDTDRDELIKYALDDSRFCLHLWNHLSPNYPWGEQILSTHTAMMGWDGVPVDADAIDRGISTLNDMIWQAEKDIPWIDDAPPLSHKALGQECAKVGIIPPKSLAKDSDECSEWEDKYGDQYPWIGAMRTWRRCNALKAKLETMRSRVKEDGRMTYALKFFGGHTGRWSGDSGVNMQNLPRGEMFGVDIRSMIKAPKGRTFVICDLAQIEPRVLAYLSNDQKLMQSLRDGFGVYTAFARANGYWDGETETLKKDDPSLYQFCKACVLGLGYMVGANKFTMMAPLLTGGAVNPTLEEAEKIVADYRKRNTAVTGFWARLSNVISRSIGSNLEIDLPSGRTMQWRNISSIGGLSSETMRGGKLVRQKIYAGLVCLSADTEVLTRDGWLKIVNVGGRQVWDGQDWVTQEGLILKGHQPTIERFGIRATPDHKFLTNKGWTPIVDCDSELLHDQTNPAYTTPMEMEEPNGAPVREPNDPTYGGHTQRANPVEVPMCMRERDRQEQRNIPSTSEESILRESVSSLQIQHVITAEESRDVQASSVRSMAIDESSMHQPQTSGVEKLRRSGDYSDPNVVGVVRELLGGHGTHLPNGAGVGSGGQLPRLLKAELPMGYSEEEYTEQETLDRSESEPVYDLLNCGPNHRFVVRGGPGYPAVIAHNCENVTQAAARDVMAWHMVELLKEGLDIIMHVHDEVVIECDESEAEAVKALVEKTMSTTPPWLPGLVIGAEAEISNHYKK
jgi:DNA polymerase family A